MQWMMLRSKQVGARHVIPSKLKTYQPQVNVEGDRIEQQRAISLYRSKMLVFNGAEHEAVLEIENLPQKERQTAEDKHRKESSNQLLNNPAIRSP